MKNVILSLIVVVAGVFSMHAQDKKIMKKATETIALEQIPGEFTQKQLTVKAGTYVFEINNNAVGHDVGFVLVKKGDDITKPENHIQTAYVTKPVANGTKGMSQATTLAKGEYVYFCPLNPTATDNTLIVN